MTVSVEHARRLALALPEAVELDHHGRPSFRVADKIFATQWDEEHMNVMLDEGGIHSAIHGAPEACEEVWWGKSLRAVLVISGAQAPNCSRTCSVKPGRGRPHGDSLQPS
ncbi:MAG: MmcQ/YjbR family DNA-binding protein [Gaiellaceae bacterium]